MVNKKDRRASLLHGCFVNNMTALIIPTIRGGGGFITSTAVGFAQYLFCP